MEHLFYGFSRPATSDFADRIQAEWRPSIDEDEVNEKISAGRIGIVIAGDRLRATAAGNEQAGG
jgi:hypothetical protein